MDEKDEQLSRLFDDYAEAMDPRPELSSRAREAMTAKTENKAKEKQPPRRAVYIGLCGLAAAAVVGVFAVGVLPRIFGGKNDSGGEDAAGPPTSYATRYNISDVRAVSVSEEFADEYISMSAIKECAEVFAADYYACYIDGADDPVYIKAVFGVAADDGVIEMCVIAENGDYRRNDLESRFDGLITANGAYRYRYDRINGEYVTMAYFEAHAYNYYVVSTSSVEGAIDIIEKLL